MINLFGKNFFFKNLFKKELKIHFNIISLLFILLPFTLVTGPFIPDLILTIISIYFLVITIKNRIFHYYKNNAVYLFCIFYLCIVVSGLLSNHPYGSLIDYNGPIFFIRYLFFVLGINYLLDNNHDLIKIFCINLTITLVFTVIDGLIMWKTGSNIFGFESPSSRVTGVFNDEEILGHFLSHTVPLAFGLLIYSFGFKKKQMFCFMIFLVISEILIFITNDRAGFLKITQFTILLIFLSNHFKVFRLFAFLFSLFIIFFILKNSSESLERYAGTFEDVASTTIPYMPWTPVHELHFKITLDMFVDSPLYGKGPQAFRIYCETPEFILGCTNHPHNYYFQTLGELGIISFIILLIGFSYILIRLFKQFIFIWLQKKKNYLLLPDHLIVLYSLAFVLFWPLIPHQSFYNNWLNVYLYLPFGFIFYFSNKNYSVILDRRNSFIVQDVSKTKK